MILEAIRCLHVPYIWGGNDPTKDEGVDCSGFVGYLLKLVGLLPEGYDDTAQGYCNRYQLQAVHTSGEGHLIFYGKSLDRITHVMVGINELACIGAIRGNKWTDTILKAKKRKARVDTREVNYRPDLRLIVDPFKEI